MDYEYLELVPELSNLEILSWEALGTFILILIGTSAVANNTLRTSGGKGGGWLMCALSWAFGVFAGASIADPSGGHLNPSVTLAVLLRGEITATQSVFYVLGQFLGAFLGALVTYLAFKKQFDTHDDPSSTRGIFCTAPTVRSYGWNTVTELIATFVLIVFVLLNPAANDALSYAAVAFVIVAIGTSLGGPTGWALNPARDFSPRVAFAVLPIKGKPDADWAYAWVPFVGPLAGAALGAGVAALML
jgi:glycerol uptake facilitator protein